MKNSKALFVMLFALALILVVIAFLLAGQPYGWFGFHFLGPVAIVLLIIGFVMGLKGK
ncbi:MAG: hypothetical protein IJY37_02650 [Clostridia bacterium]|nr:hypothetical protein [Clostridia bacterium]MBQ8419243.1 hypothetical protein [Clostridia bacterium]